MPKRAAAKKTPGQKPGIARSPLNGQELVAGNPGNSGGKKGRSGRKPLEFVQECRRLSGDAVLRKVRRYLHKPNRGPADAAWRWCAQYVTEYGHGKPPQHVTVTDDVRDETERPMAEREQEMAGILNLGLARARREAQRRREA